MSASSLEKTFLWVVKIGLWAIPFLPIYVSSSMLFPFITGKNFAFRIIIEVIFAFWVGLAVIRPEFRPRLTLLFKTVTIFVGIVFFADLFSPNPYRAFFSNYERMEGFMMLSHLYLYFVMISSVFKKKDWIIFFHLTLAASVIVSYIGLMQKLGYRISLQGGFRVDSTIGNPTYLAAYLLFHVWLLLLLMHEFWRVSWLRFVYGAILLFELMIIYFTATRGAIVALLIGSILLLVTLAWLWPKVFQEKRQWRKFIIAGLVAAVIVPTLLWFGSESKYVPSSQILSRLTSISFTERTIQSRFDIWSMSAKAALERPILGWGQENYYLVFQKYFDPGLHSQEPWFDRSHSIVFDWLIHAGFLGLASYMAILGSVFWIIFRAIYSGRFPLWTALVLGAMFLTYFLQNLFVFDNLNTLLLFFAFLAFVQFLYVPVPLALPVKKNADRNNYQKALAVFVAAAIASSMGVYFFNIVPIRQSKALIRSLIAYQMSKPMNEILVYFKDALSYDSFGTTEVREQMANMARSAMDEGRFTNEEKVRFGEFAAEELRKEIQYPAKDVKHVLFLGSLLNKMLVLNAAYAQESERVLKEAVSLSPKKQLVYFELAQLYLSVGDKNKAVDVLSQAWNVDRSYTGAATNLWTIAILAGKNDIVSEVRKEVALSGLSEEFLIKIATAYQRTERYAEALEAYDVLVKKAPNNARYQAVYAALLSFFGRNEEARKAAETALRLDPTMQGEVGEFLKRLEGR